jgi:hypothetical protein
MTSVGAALAFKIAYYAAAKAGRMTASARMGTFAEELCTKIKKDHSAAGLKTIGPCLRDAYGLSGDAAGIVALSAIKYQCPKYALLVGG